MSNSLDNPINHVKHIGPQKFKAFTSVGIVSIRDILYYFPVNYLDRTTILDALKVKSRVLNGFEGEVTIIGEVINVEYNAFKKIKLKIILQDSSGLFECIWFKGTKYFQNLFKNGDICAISSKPGISKYGQLQFIHPDYDKI
ncbi:OB-fold nucleic acid binding domain-containing protein, partial [Bacteroidota bacterium]